MTAWEKWGALTANCLMIISGSAYFVFKHWIENDDPFSILNHPLEPVALGAHILASPVLIFLFGLLFRSHVQAMLKRRPHRARALGSLTASFFVVTVLSGYLLQIVTMPVLHQALVYVHPACGLCFGLVFGIHSLRRKDQRWTSGTLQEQGRLVA